tara:strand:- start:36 stop:311 length:276 start_codon:yes stop_codon:yes gene_type:complete
VSYANASFFFFFFFDFFNFFCDLKFSLLLSCSKFFCLFRFFFRRPQSFSSAFIPSSFVRYARVKQQTTREKSRNMRGESRDVLLRRDRGAA